MKSGNFLCVFSLFFISQIGYAQDNVKVEDLVSSAKAYLQLMIDKQPSYSSNKQVTIYSFPLDSRIKLKQCDKPLTFSHNQNTQLKGTTSVKTSCRGSRPWSIYTKHRISATKTVLVMNKNLPKNHIVKDSDINYAVKDTLQLRDGYITDKTQVLGHKLKRPAKEGKPIYTYQIESTELKSILVINKNLPRNHIVKDNDVSYVTKDTLVLRDGYITDKAMVLGQKLRRPVKEGKPIYAHQIEPVELIKKGDKVNIAAKMGALTVVTSGIALDDGQKGDQIDVENVRSSRVIRTRVISLDTVEVIM
jgi:flagella basal body P-ring formation protein FlgA